ncbi:MAG: hypothetical protein ACFCUU_17635, partial [Cyclobacteriaceae bacterium]
KPFLDRSKSTSRCPDTGQLVKYWAIEGDTIISPYTGSKYVQGPTGYFGAKARGKDDRIIKFGGDPLNYDLPPAMARLLLNKADSTNTQAFLSIPGNLNQQYHFAAKNWARFYPLLSHKMGEQWIQEFQDAVGQYQESVRPSDGYRQYPPLSTPHNLVGEKGMLLGGNKQDGGTENHKVMWRSSGLLYAQLFPDEAQISGHSVGEVRVLIKKFFAEFLSKLLTTGNGEYDSQIYYPHSIEGLLNLYDFSPDPETKEIAKLTIDYLLATYALKVYDGAIAGAQKRGFTSVNGSGEMRKYLHTWFGTAAGIKSEQDLYTSVHQITTTYRPNKMIYDLMHKNVPLPFEAEIARPQYHMDVPNTFQEYFYASQNFGLGSVYMTRTDNPNQQVAWSLVVKSAHGPLTFGGAQPFHQAPAGHSPYTQTMQYKNVIMVASAPTVFENEPMKSEHHNRQNLGKEPLKDFLKPQTDSLSMHEFFESAKYHAATWLFVPKNVDDVVEKGGKIFIKAHHTYIAISPSSQHYFWIDALQSPAYKTKGKVSLLNDNHILIVPGTFSGYAVEVAEMDNYNDFQHFIDQMLSKSKFTSQVDSRVLDYNSGSGHTLQMNYQSSGLRCTGRINGKSLNFTSWAGGGAYKSPVLNIKNGKMNLSNGREKYTAEFRNKGVVYK